MLASRSLCLANQRGAVTLLTALILVIAVTLLALLSAKIVINETRVTASDYRTAQAVEAAMAAMDQGLAHFNAEGGRIDPAFTEPTQAQLDALVASCTTATPATNAQEIGIPDLATPRTLGLYYFANTGTADRCNAGGEPSAGTIVAMGWSDDCVAQRTISACLGTVPLFRDGSGPKQPFISDGSVAVTGDARIINRFTNISIWSGSSSVMSGNFSTHLRPSDMTLADLEPDELQANTTANTQLVSNSTAGLGLDIVTGDLSLANLTNDGLFNSFFMQDRDATKELAQVVNTVPPVNSGGDVTSGLYWVDGDGKINNGEWGSIDEPIVMIVDGDLDINGGEIYGMLYVTGELKIAGNITIYGSMVSESEINAGSGTPEIVFVPFGGRGGMPPPPIVDSGAVISGSWRDW